MDEKITEEMRLEEASNETVKQKRQTKSLAVDGFV
jgi:hypothetical protein